MPDINRQDIISDDALEAPLILRKNFEGALESITTYVKSAKEYAKAMDDGAKSAQDHKEKTKQLSDEQKIIAQIQKQVATETAKQSDEYLKLATTLQTLKSENRDKLKMDSEEARKITEKTASIEQLSKALDKNRQEYAKLRGEHERDSHKGKELLETIQKQDKGLQELNKTIGKSREEAKNFGESLHEALEHSGEGGEKVIGIMNSLKGILTSGWTLVGAAIAGASFAVEQFFEKDESGQLMMRQRLDLLSIRWDQFKNKLSSGVNTLLGGEENISDESRREQRTANLENEIKRLEAQKAQIEKSGLGKGSTDIIDNRIAKLKQEYLANEEIFALATQRREIEKEEIPLIVTRVKKLEEASELEITSALKSEVSAKDRLEALLKADELYKEVHEEDMKFQTARIGVANQEIYLRSLGREMNLEEKKQIQDNIASLVLMNAEFNKAEKARIRKIEKIRKEIAKENKPGEPINDNDDWHLDDMRKASAEEIKIQQEKDKKEQEEQKKSDEIIFKQDEEQRKTELEAVNKRWDHYKEGEKLFHEKRLELAQTTGEAIVRTTEQQFEGQLRALEGHMNVVKESYQEEMQMSQGNKIAQAQLTKKFREEEKIERKKMLELRRKEAEFEKAAGALTVVIKTAEAIMKDVAAFPETGGEPFAAIDAAIGAVQLVAILSKPLPSYDVGTKNHPGGKALVHPNELVKTPHGKIGLTPSIPMVVDLPKGSEVTPEDDTLNLLALAGLKASIASDRQVNYDSRIADGLNKIEKAIEQHPSQTDYYKTMSGYYAFKKEDETFTKKIIVERYGSTLP